MGEVRVGSCGFCFARCRLPPNPPSAAEHQSAADHQIDNLVSCTFGGTLLEDEASTDPKSVSEFDL